MKRTFPLLLMIFALLLTIPASLAQQQSPLPDLSGFTVTGTLNVIYGDPQPGSNEAVRTIVSVTTDDGTTYELDLAAEYAQTFFMQRVSVTGDLVATGEQPFVAVERLNALGNDASFSNNFGNPNLNVATEPVSGSQPWVNILCAFPDVPNTSGRKTPANVDAMFQGNVANPTYPSFNHYWQTVSYGTIDIDGTTTASTWVNLPNNRASYFDGQGNALLGDLFDDCTAAADSQVFYPNFVGINMLFSDVLDCCAWGGSRTATLDGATQTWRVTWDPPWAVTHGTLAHEMGHGFGFPHSTGIASNPITSFNIYQSYWDVMSRGADCTENISNFGCISANTITFNLENAGWITDDRIQLVNQGQTITTTIDRTTEPTTNNDLMIRVPVGGLSSWYYTIEARGDNSFDVNNGEFGVNDVSTDAVIIHEVDARHPSISPNGGLAHVVDATDNNNMNDDGAEWLPGETYSVTITNDDTNQSGDITIEILSKSGTTYDVRVTNNSPDLGPANDAFTDATPIRGESVTVDGSIGLASSETNEPYCYSPDIMSAGTAWYRYTAPASGTVSITNTDDSYYWVLGVGTTSGGIENFLYTQGCTFRGSGAETITFSAVEGTTYYIHMQGVFDEQGEFTLSLNATYPAPNNNTSGTAQTINGPLAQTVSGDTVGASGGNSNACTSGLNSVWYSYTPTYTGTYAFTTQNLEDVNNGGIQSDTVVSLYDANLNFIACDDDTNGLASRVVTQLTGGNQYFVRVNAAGVEGIGTFDLLTDYAYDLTGDDFVSPVDAVYLVNRLSNGYVDVFDMNSDGSLSGDDVIAILGGLGEAFNLP